MLLAEALKLQHVSLDLVRWKYYQEIGYDLDLANRIRKQGGFLALVFYRQLFDPYSVERILDDYPQAVIDFGAGVGPYENLEQFRRVQKLLAPIANVFLILPSSDIEESLAVLRSRDEHPPADLLFDINAHLIKHPGYKTLARQTIYTVGQTPAESCADIIRLLE